MAAATRPRTPSADIETAIIASAVRLLAVEGPDALSVRRLAADAGVAPMGVYNHFGGKNGVIDVVFRQGFARLAESLASLAAIDDPIDALREGFRRYRRLALDDPTTYALMFLRSVDSFEPSEESLQVAADSFGQLVAVVDRGMQAGALARGDSAEVAQQVWSACHGAIALEVHGICLVDDLERTYELLTESMLRGLATDPSGSAGSS
jgi:AcrR family transcriptional regulator